MQYPFKTTFAENIFKAKYSDGKTWAENSRILVDEVCRGLLPDSECEELIQFITDMKFIPAGRYLYYAGKELNFYNNCFCFKGEEDTREEWARLVHDIMAALMVGGGIGADYSVFRPEGAFLKRTGGQASGPLPLMRSINEVGRGIIQGAGRRAALYGSLHWSHGDIMKFIHCKDWSPEVQALKDKDFNFPADMDMTNISVNYDDTFLESIADENDWNESSDRAWEVWMENIHQMLKTAEPGMSFNFGEHSKETLRNACAEYISEDDSDMCNLGSVNFGAIKDDIELARVAHLASKFLVCGGYRAELPTEKCRKIREKNRSIGMGLMGLHEWLLKRGYRYEMNDELKGWLRTWRDSGEAGANHASDKIGINRPRRYRAIAPTGTIGILASTTTGIEPLFSVAYKRRYLDGAKQWKYEYVVDATAQHLIETYGLNPDEIETAQSLASDPERRIRFQYEVQKFVDMGISSTLNLPAFEDQMFTPEEFSNIVLKYAEGLRGLTVYPDGARGGQPLTEVPYDEAMAKKDRVFDELVPECDT